MDFHFAYGSGAARKVRIYLAELGVEVTEHPQRRGFLPVEEIAPINPCLTVPALVDGDLALYDSQVMVGYLLDRFPAPGTGDPPLLPTLVRPGRKWQDANLLSVLQTLSVSLEHIHCVEFLDQVRRDTVPYLDREHLRVANLLDWLDARATPEGFAPGWFSLMDIMLIVHAEFSETRNDLRWRDRGNLARLHAHFADRPSVAATRYPWMAAAGG